MPRRPFSVVALVTSLALAAGLGAGLGSCASPDAAPAGAARASTGEQVKGDAALVVEAVATTTELRRAFAAARRRHGRLDQRLKPYARLHARQRDTLVAALPEEDTAGAGTSGRALPPTPTAARALTVLVRRERQAGQVLTDLAVEAESGRFARLLASMAAATGQVRLALDASDEAPVGGPGVGDDAGASDSPTPDTTAPATGPDPSAADATDSEVAAAQDALAAEHAAVWLTGVLGARTSATGTPALYVAVEEAYEAHRARRDGLTTWLRDAGADPVAAAPSYRLPGEVASPRAVRRLGRQLEQATAGWWSALVASSVGDLRRDAAEALVDSARRKVALGGRPSAFPGAAELG